jgi:hypothetical protein
MELGDNNLRLLDVAGGLGEERLGEGSIDGWVYDPDEKRLVSFRSDALWLQDTSGRCMGQLPGLHQSQDSAHVAIFSFDGENLVVDGYRNRTVVVPLAKFGSPIELLDDVHKEWRIEAARSSQPSAISRSSVTRRSVHANSDGSIEVHDGTNDQPTRLAGRQGAIQASAFSSDGTRLVTGGGDDDRSICFWDTASWREMAVIRTSAGVTNLEFTPDDTRLIVTLADQTAQIWDKRDYAARQRDRDLLFSQHREERPWALSYVNAILAPPKNGADSLEENIRRDGSLSALRRDVALEVLRGRLEEINAANEMVWGFVLYGDNASKQEVEKILATAHESARLLPQMQYLNMLGLAQYRARQYKACLATLAQARAADRGGERYGPSSLIFTAMATYRLGDHAAAREMLARAINLSKTVTGLSHDTDFFGEAESLIGTATLSAITQPATAPSK